VDGSKTWTIDAQLIENASVTCRNFGLPPLIMPVEASAQPVVGQFDDAPGDATDLSSADPREGHQFIDEAILEWSEPSEDDDFEDEDEYDSNRVEDEDWEIAERGLYYLSERPRINRIIRFY
jgi:hypothetical protein